MVPDNLLSPLVSVSADDATVISLQNRFTREKSHKNPSHLPHFLYLGQHPLPSILLPELLVPQSKPITQLVLQIPSHLHLLREEGNCKHQFYFWALGSLGTTMIRISPSYKAKQKSLQPQFLIHFPLLSPSFAGAGAVVLSNFFFHLLQIIPVISLPPLMSPKFWAFQCSQMISTLLSPAD